MSGVVIGLFVVCIVLVAAVTLLRRPKPMEGELLRMRESVAVAVIGVVVLAYCLIVGVWLTNRGTASSLELLFFVGIGMAVGCAALLWYLVRCTIVTGAGVIAVGPLGGQVSLRWGDIVRMKLENGRLVLLDLADRQCTVSGSKKQMAEFAKIAKEHLKPELGQSISQLLAG